MNNCLAKYYPPSQPTYSSDTNLCQREADLRESTNFQLSQQPWGDAINSLKQK